MTAITRDEHCVIACVEALRGSGEILVSPFGVIPPIAARLGRRAGDLEADLHHRRDDLAGLAKAGITSSDEVRRLIAGYRVQWGDGHTGHDDSREGHKPR